jgi:hypothetical protein
MKGVRELSFSEVVRIWVDKMVYLYVSVRSW